MTKLNDAGGGGGGGSDAPSGGGEDDSGTGARAQENLESASADAGIVAGSEPSSGGDGRDSGASQDGGFDSLAAASEAYGEGELDSEAFRQAVTEALNEAAHSLEDGDIDAETYGEEVASSLEQATQAQVDRVDQMLEETAETTSDLAGSEGDLAGSEGDLAGSESDLAGSESASEGVERESSPAPASGDSGGSGGELAGGFDSVADAGEAYAEGEVDAETLQQAVTDSLAQTDAAFANGELDAEAYGEELTETLEQVTQAELERADQLIQEANEMAAASSAESDATGGPQLAEPAPGDELPGGFDSFDEAAEAYEDGDIDAETFQAALSEATTETSEAFGSGEIDEATFASETTAALDRATEAQVERADRMVERMEEMAAESPGEGDSPAGQDAADAAAGEELPGGFDSFDEAAEAYEDGDIDAETYEAALSEAMTETSEAFGSGELDEATFEEEMTEITSRATEADVERADQVIQEANDAAAAATAEGEPTDSGGESDDAERREAGTDAAASVSETAASNLEAASVDAAAESEPAGGDEGVSQSEPPTEATDAGPESTAGGDGDTEGREGGDVDSSEAADGTRGVAASESAADASSEGEAAARSQSQPVEPGGDWGGRGWRSVEDPGAYDDAVSEAVLKDAVVGMLEGEGVAPDSESGLSMEDCVYTRTRVPSNSSHPNTTAYVRVGVDGNPLPSPETIDAARPEGGYEDGSLEPAARIVGFEVSPVGDGDALVVSTEMGVWTGGVIENQSDAWSADSASGYESGLRDAFEASGIEFGGSQSEGDAGTDSDAANDASPPEQGESGGGGDDAVGTESREGQGATDSRDSPAGGEDAGVNTDGADVSTPASDLNPTKADTGTPVPAASGGDGTGSRGTYEVAAGDTLWDIAEAAYGDAQQWTDIYEANSDSIDDPSLIFPGQELTLPADPGGDESAEGASPSDDG